jgi:hypothetical protein
MIKTLRFGASLICLGLLTLPITACGGSSSDGKGSAGEGSVIGTSGATSGDSGGATSDSGGATSDSGGATNSNGGAIGSGAGATSSPGGSTGTGTMDAVTECTALFSTECKQLFKCLTADELAQVDVGATEAECETNLTDCSPDAAPCMPSQTYHGDQAEACVNAVGAQSCDDFIASLASDTPTPPAACATVCQ